MILLVLHNKDAEESKVYLQQLNRQLGFPRIEDYPAEEVNSVELRLLGDVLSANNVCHNSTCPIAT